MNNVRNKKMYKSNAVYIVTIELEVADLLRVADVADAGSKNSWRLHHDLSRADYACMKFHNLYSTPLRE